MIHLRTIALCFLTGCCVGLRGQDAATVERSPDLATYESFFRAVSALTTAPPLNGQTTNLAQPRLEDALGITVEEAQLLSTVAVDCAANSGAIDLALRPLVQELRFEALAEEAPSEPVTRRYNELNRQRTQIVLDHVQKLRTAFGEARFPLIETFLKANRSGESFFGSRPPLVVRPSDN